MVHLKLEFAAVARIKLQILVGVGPDKVGMGYWTVDCSKSGLCRERRTLEDNLEGTLDLI